MLKKLFALKNFQKILASCLFVIITILCGLYIKNLKERVDQKSDSNELKIKSIIEDEIVKFIYGLEGGRGVVVVNRFQPTSENFREYAKSRNYFSKFNGSLGFGFIRLVKKNELDTFLKQKEKDFFIHPKLDIDQHMIIELIEPIESNYPALGLDIAFEQNRREAALFSARTGLAKLTKKINLVQEKEVGTGFLYLLPVYSTSDTPKTEKERMENLVGWSYAPILLEPLLEKIIKKLPSDLRLSIQFSEGEELIKVADESEESLFFSKDNSFEVKIEGDTLKVFTSTYSKYLEYELFLVLSLYVLSVLALYLGTTYIIRNLRKKDKIISEKTNWMDTMITSAGHSIISTNADGIIITFNSAAEKMLGYTAEEMIGKKTPAIIHDFDEIKARAEALSIELKRTVEPGFEVFVASMSSAKSQVSEWTYIRKNGEKFIVRLSLSVLYDADSKLLGYLGIAEDLTKEREMGLLIDMQRAQMLERSKMSLLGEMAGGVAHEINTPLTIIITLAKQLAVKNENPEFSLKLLKIKETAERISRIVKGLRLYSRNSESDDFENVNLSSLLVLSLDLCREKIIHSETKLILDIEEEIYVKARSTEITQVIMNLISNSLDAIDPLEEKWIELKIFKHQQNAIIQVTDSGKGIAGDVVSKMMNPFFTTKEVGKGTGLGLSISKGIIEMHKGQMIYDQTSLNTRFSISLPISN